MQIIRKAFDHRGLETFAQEVRMRPVPRWLGNFSFKIYVKPYLGLSTPLPRELLSLKEELTKLAPPQEWNAFFLQRYEKHERVAPHRDPTNNIGYTAIAVFGTFTGAESRVAGYAPFTLEAGDVLILPCTINGVQGPRHEVSPVKTGRRWAFIMNTITGTAMTPEAV